MMMSMSDRASTEPSYESWITSFLAQRGHEFLVEVDEQYIADKFNLFGIITDSFDRSCVQLILDNYHMEDDDEEENREVLKRMHERATELFTLIHQRFILTTRGLKMMEQKYRNNGFGECPLITCNYQPLIPYGAYNELEKNTVKLFCPSCERLYHPSRVRHREIDGAFFGNTFANLFLITYPKYKINIPEQTEMPAPRVFGIMVHPDAYEVSQRAIEVAEQKLRQRNRRNTVFLIFFLERCFEKGI